MSTLFAVLKSGTEQYREIEAFIDPMITSEGA
jgi:hypothetical protein